MTRLICSLGRTSRCSATISGCYYLTVRDFNSTKGNIAMKTNNRSDSPDTPMTDHFFLRTDIDWNDEVLFCRDMERKLNEARKEAEELRLEIEGSSACMRWPLPWDETENQGEPYNPYFSFQSNTEHGRCLSDETDNPNKE